MVGDKIICLKKFGPIQLNNATSHCQSFNADQIIPRDRQESDDLVSALLSLKLSPEGGETLVSIGIHETKLGWYDSAGQRVSYSNWLPDEPDNPDGYQNYAALRIDKPNDSVGWADYTGTYQLNVVCSKTAGHGKNNSLLLNYLNSSKFIFSGGQNRNS